jgi:hypothetical protein
MKSKDHNQHDTEFDIKDLPVGHVDRFVTKLDTALHTDRKIFNLQVYAIAASVIMIIAIGITLFVRIAHFRQQPSLLTGVSPELEEAELYYQSRIQERMEVLEVNKLVDEQVMSDLKEIDQSFKSIHKDLKRNPGDERLIQAVIQVYQMKLEMIDNLLQQFK